MGTSFWIGPKKDGYVGEISRGTRWYGGPYSKEAVVLAVEPATAYSYGENARCVDDNGTVWSIPMALLGGGDPGALRGRGGELPDGGGVTGMTDEQRAWIDNASLEELLRRWRQAVAGDPIFQGVAGEHYQKTMFAKRDADPAGWTAASKRIGW